MPDRQAGWGNSDLLRILVQNFPKEIELLSSWRSLMPTQNPGAKFPQGNRTAVILEISNASFQQDAEQNTTSKAGIKAI